MISQHVVSRERVLYIVAMFSLSLSLQVFKASNPGMPLRVYFLLYDSSVEEQVGCLTGSDTHSPLSCS